MNININKLNTYIFLAFSIFIIVFINKHFLKVYNKVQIDTKKNLVKYSEYTYLYVPIIFWLASKANIFELADGYYELYIKKMLNSVNQHETAYRITDPYIGGISILAILIFALLATAAASGLGNEGVMIYSSICLMLYMYSHLKQFFGFEKIYTDVMIYIGYAIGFTIVYSSLSSTFFYILEHMLLNNSMHFFSTYGILVCAIPFIYFLVGKQDVGLHIDKLSFNFSHALYILLFSIFTGALSVVFFKAFDVLFYFIKKSKYNNLYVLICGFILAFIVKNLGFLSMGAGESAINESFQAVFHNKSKNSLTSQVQVSDNEPSQPQYTNKLNFYSVFGRIIDCIISIGSGLTGGLIIPTMTIGCGLGSILSKYTPIPQENLMYLGMSAFLSPFLDAPITSGILVNRICKQNIDTIPYSICVSSISYLTYKFLKNKFSS
jgi:H+/Cl- antiporter ClcA